MATRTVVTDAAVGSDLTSERLTPGILPMVLNSFDMTTIVVAIVLFITNVPSFYGSGPVSITWLVIGFVTFIVPSAIVTGQLGLLFPGEGSIYLWTHKAFGPFASFVAGFVSWWPGVLALTAVASAVSGIVQPLTGWTMTPWQQGAVLLLVLAVATIIAWQPFRLTQNVVNAGFLLYGVAITLIFLAGVLWLLQGHHAYARFDNFGFGAGGWLQGLNVNPFDLHSDTSTWSLYGFVIIALLGIEVPLNMGAEIKNRKAIARYLIWGSAVVMVAYIADTWALLVAADPAQGGNLASLVVPVGQTMGPILKWLVGLLLITDQLYLAVVYLYSYARLLFVSGLDRRLPPMISRVNRSRVPHAAILLQTAVAAVLTVLVYMVFPLIVRGGDSASFSSRAYLVILGANTVIWCFSMLFLFGDILYIIRKFRTEFEERRIARPAVFWACAIVGGLSSAFAVWTVFTNPFSSQLFGRDDWWHGVLTITIGSLALVPLLYVVGRRVAREAPLPPEAVAAGGDTQGWEAAVASDAMFDQAPVGICRIDAGARVVHLNRRLTEMLGYAEDQAGAALQRFAASFEERVRAGEERRLLADLTAGRRSRLTLEERLERADGGSLWCSMVVAPLSPGQGQPEAFMAIVEDITTRKMETEHAIRVQRDLLPHSMPRLTGYQLAGGCIPARDVAGDLYDWMLTRDGLLDLTVADVMGKGMAAALLMAGLRTAIRSAPGDLGPAARAEHAVQAMEFSPEAMFITLFHARLDPATGILRYVDAGHGYGVIRHPDGSFEGLGERSLPLGIGAALDLSEAFSFNEGSVQLGPGDTLIVHSDGLVESGDRVRALSDFDEEFGQAGSADDLVRRLLARVAKPEDDVTVLVLRCLADAPPRRRPMDLAKATAQR